MPRASLVTITVDVAYGPFKHRFSIPISGTDGQVSEYRWFVVLKKLKDALFDPTGDNEHFHGADLSKDFTDVRYYGDKAS